MGQRPDRKLLRVGEQNLKTRWLVSLIPSLMMLRTSSPMSSGRLYLRGFVRVSSPSLTLTHARYMIICAGWTYLDRAAQRCQVSAAARVNRWPDGRQAALACLYGLNESRVSMKLSITSARKDVSWLGMHAPDVGPSLVSEISEFIRYVRICVRKHRVGTNACASTVATDALRISHASLETNTLTYSVSQYI